MIRKSSPSLGRPGARPDSRGGRPVSRKAQPTVGRPSASSKPSVRHGVARVLSKSGVCSRAEAARWVQAGRVAVDGRRVLDPEHPVIAGQSAVTVDGVPLGKQRHRYLMLNKPRGLVTTTTDEKGRDTVYRCFDGSGLPWMAPVGRLDKASEGLLLFTSDPAWAARITGHEGGVTKTYHVQVDALVDGSRLAALAAGATLDGEQLKAVSVALLRQGEKSTWLEIVLDEGRNRHIRRLLEAHGLGVLRLVRVAIGGLLLGSLAKGQWRELGPDEVQALAPPGTRQG